MIDLLKMVYTGKLTLDHAYDIKDEVVTKFHNGDLTGDIEEELGMDNYEWTAVCHGSSFLAVALWRYEGWPQNCASCGTELDYRKFGWLAKDDQLIGLRCCP